MRRHVSALQERVAKQRYDGPVGILNRHPDQQILAVDLDRCGLFEQLAEHDADRPALGHPQMLKLQMLRQIEDGDPVRAQHIPVKYPPIANVQPLERPRQLTHHVHVLELVNCQLFQARQALQHVTLENL